MSVSRTVPLGDLTPAELAELFCEMGSEDQAEFFNEVGEIAGTWPGGGWCVQACSIVRAPVLSDAGRKVVAALADHYGLQQAEVAA